MLNTENIFNATVRTPALIFNQDHLINIAKEISSIVAEGGGNLLYSLKPCSILAVLKTIVPHIQGFSASSIFEARLANQTLSGNKSIHFISPIFQESNILEIGEICDYVVFNSVNQLETFKRHLPAKTNQGLRINPGTKFVKDDRYNPCRIASKLGVNLKNYNHLYELVSNENGLSGIHFHNNCDSNDFSHLLKTVKKLELMDNRIFEELHWISLGGGYLFREGTDLGPLHEALNLLIDQYELKVFLEPGSAFVRKAGFLVSSVLDIFQSDGKMIAILDTSVNHMPEVFEYQYEPDIYGHVDSAAHSYLLAGCSCLAGDVFGEYSFEEPLEIGSKVVFENMGAYTLVKANMFNGINLPTIYTYSEDEGLKLIKEYTYNDFLMLSGDNSNVSS